jgi:hypothetical protein
MKMSISDIGRLGEWVDGLFVYIEDDGKRVFMVAPRDVEYMKLKHAQLLTANCVIVPVPPIAMQLMRACRVERSQLPAMAREIKEHVSTEAAGVCAKLEEKVSVLNESMRSRRKISEQTKEQHRAVLMFLDSHPRCPLCRAIPQDAAFEFDHFHSNTQSSLQETWPLCRKCHGRLTQGKMTRVEALPHFLAYQAHVTDYLRRQQGSLFH